MKIVSWTDEFDQVIVDGFEYGEDGKLVNVISFVSSSITKADVEGKRDGVVNFNR